MSQEIVLCDQRRALLDTDGHILVQGGPGSGKTTIALLKANKDILDQKLANGQKILFLSFARATVSRVAEHAKALVDAEAFSSIETNTYHGFAWSLIQSHSYLITGNRHFSLLTPPAAAARVATINDDDIPEELSRLFREERLISFDLFAPFVADLLERYDRVLKLICNAYPIIIVDEFQDTDINEWKIIQALARYSTIIALADPEQRIYDFRGADPARIEELITALNPTPFDFAGENNRSSGTDISQFGNDLLTGANKGKQYNDVNIIVYPSRRRDPFQYFRYQVHGAINRLNRAKPDRDWSLAILVKSGPLMLKVSAYLNKEVGTSPPITHDVIVDPAGPALSASLIAGLLEGDTSVSKIEQKLIQDLISHIRGRKGGKTPSQADLGLLTALEGYLTTGRIRGRKRQELIGSAQQISQAIFGMHLQGKPDKDWLNIRQLLLNSPVEKLEKAGDDARYLRLLNRGSVLRENLSAQWRSTGDYTGAKGIVERALRQEYFAMPTKKWTGLNLMTIHKAKGKEFDEVIILEDVYTGRILYDPTNQHDVNQARYALRVGATRARMKTSILTPIEKPCELL